MAHIPCGELQPVNHQVSHSFASLLLLGLAWRAGSCCGRTGWLDLWLEFCLARIFFGTMGRSILRIGCWAWVGSLPRFALLSWCTIWMVWIRIMKLWKDFGAVDYPRKILKMAVKSCSSNLNGGQDIQGYWWTFGSGEVQVDSLWFIWWAWMLFSFAQGEVLKVVSLENAEHALS